MSKAADAFRTISEVATELDVPKHVLRFWEAKFAQIRPMKRGGGRRYYRPADMELLRGIQHLLHAEGYTIKGVQKILREQGIDIVKMFAHSNSASRSAGAGQRKAHRGNADIPSVAAAKLSAKPARDAAAVVVATRNGTVLERASLSAIIRELEMCKRLLAATQEHGEAERAQRRVRAGGG
jgi:DNA-binding transcriptional MerR regulator